MRAAAAAAFVAAAAWAGPAAAQTAPDGPTATTRPRLVLPPPAVDLGVSTGAGRPFAAQPDQGDRCAPAWPCRLRLFGVIEKNGGVGLKGTALTW